MKIKLLCAGLLLTALIARDASASKPGTVTGTWTGFANQSSVTLNITEGAPGTCSPITGAFAGDPIRGFYCSGTGHIFFARATAGGSLESQIYSGTLADNVPGQPKRMMGMFSVWTIFGGGIGEYPFFFTGP